MMELVNKIDVLNEFCAYCDQGACDGGGWESIQACWTSMHLRDILDDITTIDAVPVVHGKWSIESKSLGIYGCSVCDCVEETRSAYCPNCGAKMDGDE